jgi:hypothetical protein
MENFIYKTYMHNTLVLSFLRGIMHDRRHHRASTTVAPAYTGPFLFQFSIRILLKACGGLNQAS